MHYEGNVADSDLQPDEPISFGKEVRIWFVPGSCLVRKTPHKPASRHIRTRFLQVLQSSLKKLTLVRSLTTREKVLPTSVSKRGIPDTSTQGISGMKLTSISNWDAYLHAPRSILISILNWYGYPCLSPPVH